MSDRQDKISDYLLGEMSDSVLAEFERDLATDPSLASEVNELKDIVTRLDALPEEAWQPVEPPPLALPKREQDVRERESEVPAAPAARSQSEPEQPSGLRRWLSDAFAVKPAVAFAAVALFFVAGVGVGTLTGADDDASPLAQTEQQATLAPVADRDAAASGVADVKKDGQVIRLNLSGLAPTPKDKFYEAWLMDPKNGLVAIGSFRVADDGKATIDLPVAVGTDQFPIVDISLQEVNGKPDHSGVSVLRGTLN